MDGKFMPADKVEREELDWGSMAWCNRQADTGSEQLVAIEVTLKPGGGHAFHKHPQQEEVIYVIDGKVEQWLGQHKRVMEPGDSVFLPANMVHGSFNTFEKDAKLLAILAPGVGGDDGYDVIEVADKKPWSALR